MLSVNNKYKYYNLIVDGILPNVHVVKLKPGLTKPGLKLNTKHYQEKRSIVILVTQLNSTINFVHFY